MTSVATMAAAAAAVTAAVVLAASAVLAAALPTAIAAVGLASAALGLSHLHRATAAMLVPPLDPLLPLGLVALAVRAAGASGGVTT